jgi:Bacterial Ig domain/Calcineurin-like phosphoesterase
LSVFNSFFKRLSLRILVVLFIFSHLNLASPPTPALADGTECNTSGPVSGAYIVTVCLTSPVDNAVVSGDTSVTATVSVTGSNPGVQKLEFYLGGEYLLTDYSSPYTFVIPTTKFVDGARLLEVEAIMRDGLTYGRGSINLTFDNGITEPPVNTNTFTPTSGTTPAAGRPFVMVAAGDGASGEPNANAVTDLIASMDPNLFLYLGDVYNDGTATEFHNWYGTGSNYYSQFRSITNPTIGNHEYQGLQAPGYFDYWDNIPHYYSFNAAGWHFINLDTTSQYNQVLPGSEQYDWLVQDLEFNTAVCTIAYFHHPVFNVGAEGESPRMNDIWTLLADHGVDVVLAGHDHDYQRWYPMNAAGELDSNGTTEFVVGTGGHGIQDFIRTDDRLAVGFNTPPTAFGALRMELNQDGAAFQFVNIKGQTLDSGSIPCSGAPIDTTPPNAPTNLDAVSVSASHINLSWTSATDNVGVTGYQIYRDGVLLDTIGALTSYTDNMVTGNASYQYQVLATDAAGILSDLSDPASVTTPLLFTDDFESGGLSPQWTFSTGLTVQSQDTYNGTYAVQAVSTGSATWAYKTLDADQSDIYYRLRFKVNSLASNAFLMRFRTSTASLLGVYITDKGKLAYRNDVQGMPTISTTNVTYGVWHALQVHVFINDTESQTEVWLDGILIADLSNTESLGNTPVRRIQIGDNSTSHTYNILFDNVTVHTSLINMTPPEITLSEPLDNDIVKEDVALSAVASDDEGIDQVEFFANGTLIGTDYTEPYNTIWDSTTVNDGPVTLTARAVDVAFNIATSAGHVVTVDNTPPDATIDSGPSGTVNSNSATFTFSSSESSSYICLIDDEEIEDCASPQTFNNLTDGSHTFQVIATDLAGNNDPTPATRTWTIDTTVPPGNEIQVSMGGTLMGSYPLEVGQSLRQSYVGISKGPVKINNTMATPVIGAERVIYKVNGVNTSYTDVMGLPGKQLNTTYWFPWYNNKSMTTQLRIANVSGSTATVHVKIGGVEMGGSPFNVAAGAAVTKSYASIDKGPVRVFSNVNILASERVIYKVNGVATSYSELLGLPNSQLDKTFWLPWYNNKTASTELRIVNLGTSTATVHVKIGGVEMTGSPFTVASGAVVRKSYAGIDKGPVKITSNANIVASARVIYKVNSVATSYSEIMALPNKQLNTIQWLPWYNNKTVSTELRIANVSTASATVHVTIGGVEMTGSPFTLAAGTSKRLNYAGVDKGLVKMESAQNIVAAERVIYKVNNINTSYAEMMALPNGLLDATYWLPWYNNVAWDTQLRFGVP